MPTLENYRTIKAAATVALELKSKPTLEL